jgi:hypothetical protein
MELDHDGKKTLPPKIHTEEAITIIAIMPPRDIDIAPLLPPAAPASDTRISTFS